MTPRKTLKPEPFVPENWKTKCGGVLILSIVVASFRDGASESLVCVYCALCAIFTSCTLIWELAYAQYLTVQSER